MQFGRFVLRRVIHGLFVIWGAVTVVFFLRFLTPGDPVSVLAPLDADEEVRQVLRERLGLDEPFYVQYFDYLTDLMSGDLGNSMEVLDRSVVEWIFWTRFLRSVELAISATVIAIVIAIPLGVISARRRNSPADYSATLFSLLGISTPNFWLGLMLIIFVAVPIGLLPTGTPGPLFHEAIGNALGGDASGLWDWLRHMFLPAISLGMYFTALITRLTRSGMLEEIGKPYVKSCRARGIPETLTMYRHVLRNTLIPIVTILGLQLGGLIGGAVVTEVVFEWQGIGQLLIGRIRVRDWTMIQGITIVIAVGFVTMNTIVDILYVYFDPQVKYE